jgi:predicted permease
MSGTMVVLELALTVVLLVGAGLMVRSFLALYTVDIGISSDNLMTMRMFLANNKYPNPEARRAFYDRLLPRLQAIPGAEGVAFTTSVPPMGAGRRGFEIDGRPDRKPGEQAPDTITVIVSPPFFDTVGVRITRGRGLNDTDGLPGSEHVVVSERFAAQFFPNEDPIGRRLRFVVPQPPPGQPVPPSASPVWRTIVGISPQIRHSQPQDQGTAATVYIPLRQEPSGGGVILVRSHVDAGVMMATVRREVQAVDPDQPVFTVQTMKQLLMRNEWPFRVFGTIFSILAFIALTLASVGLYAVMAYAATQRTQEIGVRMALGADGRHVSWLILRTGLLQLAMGLTLGAIGAYFLSGALSSVLVQVTPTDAPTFAAVIALLTVVAIVACLVPASRAARVDPLVALRMD